MKNLISALSEKIDIVKNRPIKKGDETFFVKEKGKEISIFDVNEFITKDQRAQVYALQSFLKENEGISQEDLNKVLKAKFFKFAFLRKLNKQVPNLIEEIKEQGAANVLWRYQENKILSKAEKAGRAV